MSKPVYEGDEWRHWKEPAAISRTRAEEQALANSLYATGVIDLTEYRRRSDELSEPTRWCVKGRLKP